jgi:hypothetical protein
MKSEPGPNITVTLSSPPDPLLWGTPIAYQKKYQPLGLVLSVESNRKEVIEAADESFGSFGEVVEPASVEAVLRLLVDSVHHQKPPFLQPSFRSLGHLFHIACGDASFAVADLKFGTAIGFVAEEIVQDRSFFRNVFVECLFYVIAVQQRFTPVHTACVVWNGKAMLIWGLPGAGKSTLAYACAKGGMQLVTDDVIHLETDPVSGQLTGWGRPWQLRLLPDAKTLFPELIGEEPRLRSDHQWYLEIDMRKKFPTSPLVSCRPSALLFLNRTDNPSSKLEPFDRKHALTLLKQDIYLTEETVLSRHYAALEKLVQLDVLQLSYSGPPAQAVALIQKLRL